jgi:hypothetical protein
MQPGDCFGCVHVYDGSPNLGRNPARIRRYDIQLPGTAGAAMDDPGFEIKPALRSRSGWY